ncbi:ribosomal protein L1p/L10e family-domain-containing protein [Cunninghamella echinulata]|nr:ribosomal protein L1p/L10e family-domain-containing protein [Cunninghamella echinulata]
MSISSEEICKQADLAIKALTEYLKKKNQNDILDSDLGIWCHITLAKHVETTKSQQIELSHPICDDQGEVCLVVHNEPKKYQAIVDKMDLPRKVTTERACIKVYSGKQIKENYQRYEAKRQLARDYDLFLIDASLAHKINALFGDSFKRASKLPIIAYVSRNEKIMNEKYMKENLLKALNTTSLPAAFDSSRQVKIGHNHMTDKELLDNFKAVLETLISLDSWKFVQCVSLHADQSISLPVYACVPGTWLIEDSVMEEGAEEIEKMRPQLIKEREERKNAKLEKERLDRQKRKEKRLARSLKLQEEHREKIKKQKAEKLMKRKQERKEKLAKKKENKTKQ